MKQPNIGDLHISWSDDGSDAQVFECVGANEWIPIANISDFPRLYPDRMEEFSAAMLKRQKPKD